jgi:hypothetical protein
VRHFQMDSYSLFAERTGWEKGLLVEWIGREGGGCDDVIWGQVGKGVDKLRAFKTCEFWGSRYTHENVRMADIAKRQPWDKNK